MKTELNAVLNRWAVAGLISNEQTERIREYEATHTSESTTRLPIALGLALGGLMAAAGLLLFVSAHWAVLSPAERMTVLIASVGGGHIVAALTADRFPATSSSLHAVGSMALGGAIFLAAQVFNLEEHWPSGLLLWALGAAVAWALLRQWPQLALAALLIPAWLTGEWADAASGFRDSYQIASVGIAVLAICYLTVPSEAPAVYRWIGRIAVLPAVIGVSLNREWFLKDPNSDPLAALGWIVALAIPLSFALYYRRCRAWIDALACLWIVLLSFSGQTGHGVLTYAWCAIGSIGMIFWGITENASDRVNTGMIGFALTIFCFFFSSVMDKLGRSMSLMVLGLLFLGGGWYWEKVRRQLVRQSQIGGAQ